MICRYFSIYHARLVFHPFVSPDLADSFRHFFRAARFWWACRSFSWLFSWCFFILGFWHFSKPVTLQVSEHPWIKAALFQFFSTVFYVIIFNKLPVVSDNLVTRIGAKCSFQRASRLNCRWKTIIPCTTTITRWYWVPCVVWIRLGTTHVRFEPLFTQYFAHFWAVTFKKLVSFDTHRIST